MKWHSQACAASIAVAAFFGLAKVALADAAPVTLPPAQSNTPGPTTQQSQEVSAVSGPRAEDPFFEPKGIPLGGPFRLFPNLFTSLGFDDNVYRGKDGAKVSSSVFEADPTLILDYDLSRMRLDLFGQASYQDLEQYNLWTFNGGLQGQLELMHDLLASFNVSDGRFYEPYSSANTVAFEKRPNEYQLFDVSDKVSYKPSRLGFSAGGSFDNYLYTRTPLIGGGSVPFGSRDANIEKGWVEASYDFSPGYSGFVKATYNNDELFRDPLVPTRSSHGYNFDGGIDLLLGDLAQGEIYVGYLDQLYHKPTFKDISGLDYGANVTWYPTELLTIHLAGQRQIENTILANSAAGDDKSATLSADYELLRRLHLLANVGYDDINYKGTIPRRDDKTLSAGVGGKWLLSHYVWLNANYQYQIRSSTIPVAEYVDNFASIGLNLQD